MSKHSTQPNDITQANELRSSHASSRIPWWISTIVILGALLTATGAVISKIAPTMLTNGDTMTGAARVYADYMFARNLPLALLLLLLLAIGARRMLAGVMVLIALIQIFDVINDLARGAIILVPGLLVFAIAFLIGASRLIGRPFWQVDAWRDGS
jgi:hypothetical protein